MKLLLTSAGLTNDAIAKAAIDLVGKPAAETSVLFIPTAANSFVDDKGWLIDNLVEFQKRNFKRVDILDLAGLPKDEWLPHVEAADLICFGGGNEQYLAKVMRDSGFADMLPELLKTKVYMGISAGSMVMGQFLSHDLMKIIYPEEAFEELAHPFGYVDFAFVPHLNSEYFQHVRKENLESHASQYEHPVYACDDETAIKIVDGNVEFVGGGETIQIG